MRDGPLTVVLVVVALSGVVFLAADVWRLHVEFETLQRHVTGFVCGTVQQQERQMDVGLTAKVVYVERWGSRGQIVLENVKRHGGLPIEEGDLITLKVFRKGQYIEEEPEVGTVDRDTAAPDGG